MVSCARDASCDHAAQPCSRCHQTAVWRIQLMRCHHVFCVLCILEHIRHGIQEEHKAIIKCPRKSCPRRIHENDIAALLDSQNADLDAYMPLSQREWLQFVHECQGIKYAIGEGNWVQCPLCLNLYAKAAGCNYVRCANLRCNQWFCSVCGNPIESFQHFTQGQCRVGFDDIFRLTYFLRFLVLSNGVTNLMLWPCFAFSILAIFPVLIAVGFPLSVFRALERRHLAAGTSTASFAAEVTVALLFALPAGILLGVCSLASASIFNFFYTALVFIKVCSPVAPVFKALDMAGPVLGLFGFGDWRKILRDSAEARAELRALEQHRQAEKEFEIPSDEMNSQERQEANAAIIDEDEKIGRAVCATPNNNAAIDAGDLIRKGHNNLVAAAEADFSGMQMVAVGDVKVNDAKAARQNLQGLAKK